MIHVRSFRTAGKCHGFDISRCQDQIRILSDATQTTIVLCDGAGSSPYGGIAASVTASILARNLHSNFEQYLHNALPDIKMQLTRTINNELKKWQKKCRSLPDCWQQPYSPFPWTKTADLSVYIWEMDAYYGTLTVPTACRPFLHPKVEIPQIQPILP